MADRALPDLVARIRVDSAGVDAALLSLVGGIGRAQAAMVGLGAAIGLLIIGGKSMLDIALKEDAAHRGLAQAVEYYNSNLGKSTKTHLEWVSTAGKARDTAAQLAAQQLAVARANEAENVAQAAYTRALYTYGPQSDKTMKAELALENAKMRLVAAQAKVNAQADQASGKWVTVAGTQARAKLSLEDYQKSIEAFIAANKAYIRDQAEVTDGAAQLIRSGLSQKEVQLDLNRALDLSAIKHISLSDAVNLVDNAEHGRLRGLIDLGITSSKYVDSSGNVIDANKNMSRVMGELDAKTAHGRDTLTDYQKKWNILNNDWQALSIKGGPVIETLLDTIVGKLNDAYDALDRIGNDDALWGRISDRLTTWAQQIHDFFVNSGLSDIIGTGVADFLVWLMDIPKGTTIKIQEPPVTLPPGQGYNPNRAGGGEVLPNRMYRVGEEAEETLVMRARGGYVIPGASRRQSVGTTILPVVFSSMPPSREQMVVVRDAIRRLDREHR